MRKWTKLLPFFIVEWYALKYLGRLKVGSWAYVQPYGPFQDGKPETSILIEDVSKRPPC